MDEFLPDDPEVQRAHPHTKYDLIANICHDGAAGMNRFDQVHFSKAKCIYSTLLLPSVGPGKGTFRVHVRHKVGPADPHPTPHVNSTPTNQYAPSPFPLPTPLLP